MNNVVFFPKITACLLLNCKYSMVLGYYKVYKHFCLKFIYVFFFPLSICIVFFPFFFLLNAFWHFL